MRASFSIKRNSISSRLAVGVLASFLAAGVLSACSDGDAVTAGTSVSSSPAPEPSVTTDDVVSFVEPEKPQVTAGMKNNDVQGAKEAIEYFGKVLTYAALASDESVIETIEIEDDFDDCAPCIATRDLIKEAKNEKKQYADLTIKFNLYEEPEEILDGMWSAKGDMTVSTVKLLDSDGKLIKEYPEDSFEATIAVQYEESGWKFIGTILP